MKVLTQVDKWEPSRQFSAESICQSLGAYTQSFKDTFEPNERRKELCTLYCEFKQIIYIKPRPRMATLSLDELGGKMPTGVSVRFGDTRPTLMSQSYSSKVHKSEGTWPKLSFISVLQGFYFIFYGEVNRLINFICY